MSIWHSSKNFYYVGYNCDRSFEQALFYIFFKTILVNNSHQFLAFRDDKTMEQLLICMSCTPEVDIRMMVPRTRSDISLEKYFKLFYDSFGYPISVHNTIIDVFSHKFIPLYIIRSTRLRTNLHGLGMEFRTRFFQINKKQLK